MEKDTETCSFSAILACIFSSFDLPPLHRKIVLPCFMPIVLLRSGSLVYVVDQPSYNPSLHANVASTCCLYRAKVMIMPHNIVNCFAPK